MQEEATRTSHQEGTPTMAKKKVTKKNESTAKGTKKETTEKTTATVYYSNGKKEIITPEGRLAKFPIAQLRNIVGQNTTIIVSPMTKPFCWLVNTQGAKEKFGLNLKVSELAQGVIFGNAIKMMREDVKE